MQADKTDRDDEENESTLATVVRDTIETHCEIFLNVIKG
jgi:hypothetical protein